MSGLYEVLSRADEKEKQAIVNLITSSSKETLSIPSIIDEISRLGGHSFANFFRGGGVSYDEILNDIIKLLKIEMIQKNDTTSSKNTTKSQNYEKLENKITLNYLDNASKKMSYTDKKKFEKEINKILKEEQGSNDMKYIGASAGLIALGNLGGFATYTLLTSLMSTVSLGTLGFSTYIAATTGLSILLGPVGVGMVTGWAILRLGKPNYKKLVPIVINIFLIRQRYKKLDEKLRKKALENQTRLDNLFKRQSNIKNILNDKNNFEYFFENETILDDILNNQAEIEELFKNQGKIIAKTIKNKS